MKSYVCTWMLVAVAMMVAASWSEARSCSADCYTPTGPAGRAVVQTPNNSTGGEDAVRNLCFRYCAGQPCSVGTVSCDELREGQHPEFCFGTCYVGGGDGFAYPVQGRGEGKISCIDGLQSQCSSICGGRRPCMVKGDWFVRYILP